MALQVTQLLHELQAFSRFHPDCVKTDKANSIFWNAKHVKYDPVYAFLQRQQRQV